MINKQEYTNNEWSERETYYIEQIKALKNSFIGQTSTDVLERLSILDTLSTEATFEFMFIERNLSRVELDLKNAERELFTQIKMEQLANGVKVTESDIKGLVKTYLKNNILDGYKAPIFDVLKVLMHRSAFMNAVVDDIKNRRSSIISSLSLLKIESSLSPATQDIQQD